MGKTCFFIGNHDAPERIMELLKGAVELHIIDDGVTEFYVGQYGKFDSMAARAVIQAKKQYSYVKLILVRPYHPSERKFDLPEGFDDSIYPEGMELVPKRYAISRVNQYMIDHVDYLITYVENIAGNARKLVDYARHRVDGGRLKVEDIYEAACKLLKPVHVPPEKMVLLTSHDENVTPRVTEVLNAVEKLISDGFSVMVTDTTTPFGQLALLILFHLREFKREYMLCSCASRPVHQRKNALKALSRDEGYINLCIRAENDYFYNHYDEVLTSVGYICTEKGMCAVESR